MPPEMPDRRYVQDLSIEELEHELLIRRRSERLARLRRLGVSDAVQASLSEPYPEPVPFEDETGAYVPVQAPAHRVWRDRILLVIEIAALIGLLIVIVNFVLSARRLNEDWQEQNVGEALPTPTATALIRVSVLPGGHKPPPVPGGEGEPLAQMLRVALATPGPRSPERIRIPAIGVDLPVYEGVDWDTLKRGPGHLIGSANPGERGNCFIAGHNDIYGQPFRFLEDLAEGDEIIVRAGARDYVYIVQDLRIIDPDDVSVMEPTSGPILTLLTCHPYMIDTHRLVVIAVLDS